MCKLVLELMYRASLRLLFLLFRQVLEVVSGVKGEDAEKLSEIFYNNTMKLFFEK